MYDYAFREIAEEGDSGAQHIDRSLISADLGYVFDSSGSPGKMINKAPSENSLIFNVFGRATHAGVEPKNGLNAVILAANALSKIPNGHINSILES